MNNEQLKKIKFIKKITKSFFVFCFLLFIVHSSLFIVFAEGIKEPNVAGAFYPADKEELTMLVQKYLNEAREVNVVSEASVLIVPHAGYVYSGPVAAYGFKAVFGETFDTVIILAASHYFPYSGVSVYQEGVFKTPLGDLNIDAEMAQDLLKLNETFLFNEPRYFQQEHSVEVELPFLQMSLKKGFKILPLLMGEMSYQQCLDLAGYISQVIRNKKVLVLVSTDLSHYRAYEEAVGYDEKTVQFIKRSDARGLWDAVQPTGWNVCGIRPVVVGMNVAKLCGATKIDVLKYANSGDTAVDRARVVGYASVVFSKGTNEDKKGGNDAMLTKEDKKRLLEIARITVEAVVSGKKTPQFNEKSPGLKLKNGAFVTLTNKGNLRGCIGAFASRDALYKTIVEMATAACSQDDRFSSVSSDELKDIEIEISVLSEPKPIDDWRKIKLGVDGVIVRKGFSSGVFLPQVATETGWDLDRFLGELCSQKAGMPRECYKDPETKILTFQADIFNENEMK
jgi:AmmeMemoRadiSam system protein B/AmmeMemoRadiSam system protein A